jgi:hypothetical protein
MLFIDRQPELGRLERLAAQREGGLAVLYGRRRIGKTRLLLEWTRRTGGAYTVADQSSAEVQRRYFARAVAQRLAGFADVEYLDWQTALDRLARDARTAGWHGPVVLDELPYLVAATPELPSVLQRWIDHEANAAHLLVAVAGSSQRMMQGLVLGSEAPLYGRASELLAIGPLAPEHLKAAFVAATPAAMVEHWAAWGGVPRYWELAAALPGTTGAAIDALMLDPLGVLHREPDHLLIEEVPPALEVRPVLDAIGAGAHRVSEIAGRIGRPATSLARPLDRLIGMGLVRREVPFGEPERSGKRSLYRIDDPFFRLWFRVVAPQRALLTSGSPAARRQLLARHWPGLVAAAWEELCRRQLGHLSASSPLGRFGPWGPAARWWHGGLPEWDVVSEDSAGRSLLLGEVRWSAQAIGGPALARALADLSARRPPDLPPRYAHHTIVRALFVPALAGGRRPAPAGAVVVTAAELLPGAKRRRASARAS